MQSSFEDLPKEVKGMVIGNLNSTELRDYCATTNNANQLTNDPGIWLDLIEKNYGVSLTNKQAYSMLLQLFAKNIIIHAPVTLYDDKREYDY